MRYFIAFVSSLLLLSACHKDDEPDFSEKKATRAVIVYMAGENNLTENMGYRYLQTDLAEMVEGSKELTDNQRLFVFVDSLGTNKDRKGTPYIAELHGGQVIPRKTFSEDFRSSSPERFAEVISWMTSNIQADGYGLVLWGHASGWIVEKDTVATTSKRAYGLDTGNDEGSSSSQWMNITQMAEALKGLPKLDFIFADCCNMLCAENGYELRNATDYLIGSPAEIPGDGAPYQQIVPLFYQNGSALYRGIIDNYYNYYLDAYKIYYTELSGSSVPLGVIETRYMEALAQQTRNVVATFATTYPERLSLQGLPFYVYIDSPMLYDMRAVIKKYASADDFAQWDQVFHQAVPYYRTSTKWMSIYQWLRASFSSFANAIDDCGSVSMFVPQPDSNYNAGDYRYNYTAGNFGWNRIVGWQQYGWGQ